MSGKAAAKALNASSIAFWAISVGRKPLKNEALLISRKAVLIAVFCVLFIVWEDDFNANNNAKTR